MYMNYIGPLKKGAEIYDHRGKDEIRNGTDSRVKPIENGGNLDQSTQPSINDVLPKKNLMGIILAENHDLRQQMSSA